MKIKTPNPITKDANAAQYFDNTGDGGIRCIAAALSIDGSTHIVICAPDAVVLRRAWEKLTKVELDIKKSPVVIYKYEVPQEGLLASEFSVKKKDGEIRISELKQTSNANSWYWYYYPHSKHAECFIEEYSFIPDRKEIKLGEAKDCSKEECLALLRANKIPRSEISNININTSIDELIPF